jgi:hypothetical protein
MDVPKLRPGPGLQPRHHRRRARARAQAPRARVGVGSWASDDRAKLLARSLGVRDLALGAPVLAVRDRGWGRRTFAAQAAADSIDFAVLLVGRNVPLASRVIGGTTAAGSGALTAAYARSPDV